MMDVCQTVRVMPWGKDQGDFVEINVEDFDPKIHRPFNAAEVAEAISKAAHVEIPLASDVVAEPAPASAEKPVPRAKKPRRKKGK